MPPLIPSFLLFLLLAGPALLAATTSRELEVRGQRTPRDTKQDAIKVVISEGCATQGESSDSSQGGKEVDLIPGTPLVLTHRIKLVPSGSGPGSCGCEADFAVLRERLERLEREVSALREKCGGPEGGCCTSKESKGAGCSIKPEVDECPNECSDQGRCVDGKCVCFPGFSGPDCSQSNCPGNCNNKGRCLNGECVCDPGFSGPSCSQKGCPDNCNNRGRCVNGRCVCDSGFAGPSCSENSCPGNCNNKGRCVNGQCVCNPGFTGPDCSDRACPDNCNNRGRCVNGQCVCDSGFTGTDCSDRACPDNCNNRGRCVNGQCVCDSGFTGTDCSDRACPDNCNNRGRCVNGQCVCDSGFTGTDCSDRACPDNCNNRGRCVNGQCVCDSGFTGTDCSDRACPDNCNNRGRCVNGQCVCDSGFTGTDCSDRACPDNCNNRGRCVNGQCVCDSGFTGTDCSDRACPDNCNNRGRCVDGQCVCDSGFTGTDCSDRACPDNCNNRGRCVNGQCVCDSGFTGTDCSESSCPGNCNNKGRCVNGQCVCKPAFTGPDCSERVCPSNCNNRGRCVNGKCVCAAGYTGSDCSKNACPDNCNKRGRCVDGQCVCNPGFTGLDCSTKACPNNCSNSGKCVNGKCVCDAGFAGPDCAAKSCPNNCSDKGRCVKGRCVCRRGFTGPDCSQCEPGMTGPNCDTVMSSVSQLSTRDITETSVTLFWTPPPVQYHTYHITFTSQKESDQQITVQVEGSLTTYTQTGLAAGQEYTVTVTGETGGRKGAESSAEFTTLISGPANLQVVKTTTTSAVVQWERSTGEIDRYRLTISPNDGGLSQEMIIPPDRDSAQIEQLEAGRLYDIILIAEKGSSQSEPAATQATPGKTLPRVTMAAVTTLVTPSPGHDARHRDRASNLTSDETVFDQPGGRKDGGEVGSVKVGGIIGSKEDSSTTVIARTKPLVSRKDGVKPKAGDRPILPRKPNAPGSFRFNGTRLGPGGKRVGPGPLKKPPGRGPLVGTKEKPPIAGKGFKPGSPVVGDRTLALTVKEPSSEASSTGSGDNQNQAKISPADFGADTQGSSGESTVTPGSKEQPEVGMAGSQTGTGVVEGAEHPMSSLHDGNTHPHEKKCFNKVKVTHIRLPHRGPDDGAAVVGGRPTSHHNSSETEESVLNLPATGHLKHPQPYNNTSDPLYQLLTDTFDSLNITTFSVHLSKPSDLSLDADAVTKQILGGLKPLSPSSSSSVSSQTSSSLSSSSPSSSAASSSPTSLASSSSPSSLSQPSSSPSSQPSPSSSSSENSDLVKGNEPEVDTGKNGEKSLDTSQREGGLPQFRRPKGWLPRRPHPNTGPFQNRTRLTLRPPNRPLNVNPGTETETSHIPSGELSPSSSSSSTSEESFSIEGNSQERDANGDREGGAIVEVEDEQNQAKSDRREGGGPIFRRRPSKGRFPGRPNPNMGQFFQNLTHPKLRLPHRPPQHLNPEAERHREQTSELPSPMTSSSTTKDLYQVEDTTSEQGTNGDKAGTTTVVSVGTEVNQTLREKAIPPFRRTSPKFGYQKRPHPNMGLHQNRTRPNLRPPHHSQRGPLHKPFPPRKLNGGDNIAVGIQTSPSGEQDNTPGVPVSQSGEDGVRSPTHRIQTSQSGEQDNAKLIQSGQSASQDKTLRIQTNKLGEAGIITTDSETDSDSDINKETVNTGKFTGPIIRDRPKIKQSSSDTGHRALKPTTPLKRKPPVDRKGTQGHTQMRNITVSQTGEDSKTDHPGKGRRVIKMEDMRSESRTLNVSDFPSGDTRDALDHVGVRNLTSDGFTLVWDAPEGKYKNFVVTRKEQGDKDQQPREEKQNGKGEGEQEEEEEETAEVKQVKNGGAGEKNQVPESEITHTPGVHSSTTAKHATGSGKTFTKVLPGSARSFPFENLPPQTPFTVTLLGKGPGLLSRLHKLVISTGPEPPSDLTFSAVTENSVTVSWTKPNSPINGFKVTYTHTEEGEPVSVSVDSEDSTLDLSQLVPGSTYEVSVISVLGLDESDPIKDSVMTLPDPPTHLRAMNVTDSKALLLWRPALASVDKYAIVYGAGKDSELRITVSGNAAEQQLSGLEGSTTYTVTITSLLGSLESSPATTTFTTTSGSGRDGEGPQDLQASQVTPRTALLSWKPPSVAVGSYKLTYQTEGQEMKEVTVDATVTEYKLSRLHPGSKYTVQLQGEQGGLYTSAISTEFTTGTLRFPFPTDCSQERLNGIRESGEADIFPQGKHSTPLMVYCDMETDGGGWTVFQRRKDGSVDFFRGWKEYIKGFGDLSGEFWLGLESLHNLTAMTRMSLRVDLRDGDQSVFAKYSTFEVAKKNYRLTVAGYSGTAGDSMTYHNNRLFSTRDRDPAPFITRCAMSYRGGWWYRNCHEANLNGLYGIDVRHQGVIWTSWKGKDFSIPFTEMKMRPTGFSPPAQ